MKMRDELARSWTVASQNHLRAWDQQATSIGAQVDSSTASPRNSAS
jgi:hypothetical protein